jgi:putative ABC transport system permease protein
MRLSGRLRSALIIGGQGIRARKLRTLLSMISLFLGVLAVVVVQAGAETAKRALLSNLEIQVGIDGTRILRYPSNPATAAPTLEALHGRPGVVGAMAVHAVLGEPGVRSINPGGSPLPREGEVQFGPGQGGPGGPGGPFGPFGPVGPGGPEAPQTLFVCDGRGACYERSIGAEEFNQPPGRAIELSLTMLTGDLRQFKPFHMESGRWLDFGTMPSMSPAIVVNEEAAKGLRRYQIPAELRIEGAVANATPRIVGVVDDGRYEPAAYVTAAEMLNWLPLMDASTQSAQSEASGMWEVMFGPGADATEQILRSRLVAMGMPADGLQPETINSRGDIARELALTRLIFLGLAALVLLIGVAGILNVGLATVGERIEEFALRRAVGTPRSLLAGIVLAETLLTGLLTAAAAIGAAALGFSLLADQLASREPILASMQFPWQAGVAGVVAGLAAGLLGGLIPALRAARIPIATVMRA